MEYLNRLIGLWCCCLVFATASNAQLVISGSETQANTTTLKTQQWPSAAMESDGDFAITWESYNPVISGYEIYLQRFGSSGSPLGGEALVNTSTGTDHRFPAMAMDKDGNFIIVWQSINTDGDGWGIYGQRYDDGGLALGGEFLVNTITTGQQRFARVAMDTGGNFTVVWESEFDIKMQQYDNTGAKVGIETTVNTTVTDPQSYPDIAMDHDGDMVIAWQSLGQDGSEFGVFGQLYDKSAASVGSEFQVNTASANGQLNPRVGMDAAGNFTVTWVSNLQDGSQEGIYAQRFSSSGSKLGMEFPVNTNTAGAQDNPEIEVSNLGDILITWNSYDQDGSRFGVYARSFSSSGASPTPEILINTTTTNYQQSAAIALWESNAIIAWQDGDRFTNTSADGEDYGIFFNAATLSCSEPVAVCKDDTVQLDITGIAVLTATDLDGGSIAACGLASLIVSPDTLDCSHLGIQTVLLIITDSLGNSDTCMANVTVEDNISPAISCPADIAMSNDVGQCSAVATFPDPMVTDNCPGTTTLQIAGLTSGSVFPIGTTTNTFVAIDASGNEDSCSFTITINDGENPSIICPPNVTVNNDLGQCTAVLSYSTPTGIDNCLGASTVQTAGFASGSAFPVGTTTNTFVVTDSAGNTASCSFDITVIDAESPAALCSTDLTVGNDAGLCSAVVSYPETLIADNCPGVTSTQIGGLASGATFPIGSTKNTFVATDAAGNTDTCSFTVNVVDSETPSISCPSDIVTSNDSGLCEANVSYTTPSGSDNCPGATTIQTAGLPSGSTFPVGTTTNTFVVTDASGNSDSCSFTVTVNDMENPSITCPADTFLSSDLDSCGATYNFAIGISDNCPGATLAQIVGLASGSFPVGTTTNTFVVTDASGNTDTCSFNVTVTDGQQPDITTAASDSTVECDGTTDPSGAFAAWLSSNGGAIASDNCGSVTWSNNSAGLSTACGTTGFETVTFFVTDLAGNNDSVTATFTIEDTTPPSLTIPGDTIIACTEDLNPTNTGNATATDNCGVNTSPSLVFSDSTIAGPCGLERTIVRRWTATDDCGNSTNDVQNISIIDTLAPVITIPASSMIALCDGGGNVAELTAWLNSNAGAIASDSCGTISWTNDFTALTDDCGATGSATVTFTASDECGNTVTTIGNFIIEDHTPPLLVCASDTTALISTSGICETFVTVNPPEASDNCSGVSLTNDYNGTADASDVYPEGTTLVTWTATDSCGNVIFCLQSITVYNVNGPSIICVTEITSEVLPTECGRTIAYPIPTVIDDCPGTTVSQLSGLGSGAFFPVGTSVEVWVATDASGNTDTCYLSITVIDLIAPMVNCPADTTTSNDIDACAAVVNFAAITATDNCPIDTIVQIAGLSSGSSFPVGVTTNTFVATDASGNTDTCSFTVTVEDTQTPVVSCPSDTVISNDTGLCEAVVNYNLTFADNCPGASIAQVAGLASGSSFPVGTTTNTFVVTDSVGLTDTCSFTVTVADTESPLAICPVDLAMPTDSGACDAIVSYTAPSVADNCPGSSIVQISGLASGAVFPIGNTVNTFVAIDSAGNTDTCSFTVTVLDMQAPTISCPADITAITDPGSCGAIISYTEVVGTDNCPGATTIQVAGFSDGVSFPVGMTTNTFVVTDAAGNTDTCSFTVTVLDTESPVVSCPLDISVSNDQSSCEAMVTYTVSSTDNCPGDTIIQIAGLSSGSAFPVGTTTNTFVAVDATGNADTCSFDVTVSDTESPVASCPPAISMSNDLGQCGAVVTYSSPTVADNCPGATIVQIAGLASGTFFPEGVTTNTYVAIDAAGNADSCSFTVTVNDEEAPNIVCPPNLVFNNEAGLCGAAVFFANPTASDNCGPLTLAQTDGLVSGSFFPPGITVVEFTATDFSGNSDSCSFTVTVLDIEPPTVINCPSDVLIDNSPGECGSIVNYIAPIGADNCPGVNVLQIGGLGPGAFFPSGETVELYEITDASGNSTTCAILITVNYTNEPGVSATTINESAAGAADGSIDLTVIGGLPPYSYSWSNGDNTEDIFGLEAGTYDLQITDSLGCVTDFSVNVEQNTLCIPPNMLQTTILDSTSVMVCWNPVPGALRYRLQGRKIGGSYRSRITTSTCHTVSGLTTGETYEWRVTVQCTDSTISTPSFTQIFTLSGATRLSDALPEMKLYPNPTNDQIWIDYKLSYDSKTDLRIVDVLGRTVLTDRVTLPAGQHLLDYNLAHLAAGIYTVHIMDANYQMTTKLVISR